MCKIYICIGVGGSIIKGGGLGFHYPV